MNWNWLPWRGAEESGTKDSTHEEEVIDRCDHDFEQTTELLPYPRFGEAKMEEGHLVVPHYERVEEFCTKCGEPGLDGEASPYGPGYVTNITFGGEWIRVAQHLVFKPDFVMDPDLSVSDAFTEEVEEEGENRVIVSREEEEEEAPLVPHTDFGVTD